jgi:hypothetical protein
MLRRVSCPATAASPRYLAQAREEYLRWSDIDLIDTPGALQMPVVIRALRDRLPPDTIPSDGAMMCYQPVLKVQIPA